MASVNIMNFNQASQLITSLHNQTTGKTALVPTNTSEFVSVAQRTLAAGTEPVINELQQLVTRTAFSIRNYEAKFKNLRVTNQYWGSITRKLSISDKDFENDARFELVDGQSVDMYKVNKPNILNMNFYGTNVWAKTVTIFRDQLNSAFTGPDQFGEFLAMITGNALDMITQANEELARANVANFIGGKVAANNGVVHLLTEYKEATGLSDLTAQTVMQPSNFPAFAKWVNARIEKISSMMTERTGMYQIQVDGKWLNRHTPKNRQKVLLNAQVLHEIASRVLADTYHDTYLKQADVEEVNFWQSSSDPMNINVEPVYLNTNGKLITGEAAAVNNIYGIIFDEEALGYTVMNEWSGTTQLNTLGGYWNTTYHMTRRFWADYTEKAAILLLD